MQHIILAPVNLWIDSPRALRYHARVEKLAYLPLFFVPFLFSLSFHEAAHAWMANRRGDPTARMLGRMTLNPMAHIDLVGTIIFPVLAFISGVPLLGWAKPVPILERNFRNWRLDGLLVAAAGPVSNLILAVGFALLFGIILRLDVDAPMARAGIVLKEPLLLMTQVGIQLNVILALFNFIPIPPLDGSRVFQSLFPSVGPTFALLERYGILLFYFLILTGIFRVLVFQPAQFLSGYLMNWVS